MTASSPGHESPGLPLCGVRVADFSSNVPGPLVGRLLQQLGAEVWKIERPGAGDVTRDLHIFDFLNAGKKGVELDLRDPAQLRQARDLVLRSDVVIDGFRPGVMAGYGLGPEELAAIHPELVYCALSGYGQQGPRSKAPAHDLNVMALGGLLHRHREVDGTLVRAPMPGPIADVTAALLAVVGVLAVLGERGADTRRRLVDVSMLDASLLLGFIGTATWHAVGTDDGVPPLMECPHYAVYTTADDRAISLGITWQEEVFWARFCKSVGLDHLARLDMNARMARADEIRDTLARLFATAPLEHWCSLLENCDAPWAPVNDAGEAAKEAEAAGRLAAGLPGSWIPVGLGSQVPSSPGPRPGQHSRELEALLRTERPRPHTDGGAPS